MPTLKVELSDETYNGLKLWQTRNPGLGGMSSIARMALELEVASYLLEMHAGSVP